MKKYISNAVLSISSYFNKIGLIVPILFLFLELKAESDHLAFFYKVHRFGPAGHFKIFKSSL